jgi:cytochrome b subunit of formate dehydrogenase
MKKQALKLKNNRENMAFVELRYENFYKKMKTILIILTFMLLISSGIYLDSMLVNFTISLLPKLSAAWLVFTKMFLWILLSIFTGGPIFAISFIITGAIKTELEK